MRRLSHWTYLCWLAPLVISITILTAGKARADDPGSARLVHIESTSTTPSGMFAASAQLRIYGSPENGTYPAIGFRYGLTDRLELGVRGVLGTNHSFATAARPVILDGGRDVEAFAKYRFAEYSGVSLAALAGISFPDTPAQNQATGTLSGIASTRVGSRATVYLNPRAVFLNGNSIVGIGAGAAIPLGESLQLVGDWTGIVTGDNTRSTADGSLKQVNVWGAAL